MNNSNSKRKCIVCYIKKWKKSFPPFLAKLRLTSLLWFQNDSKIDLMGSMKIFHRWYSKILTDLTWTPGIIAGGGVNIHQIRVNSYPKCGVNGTKFNDYLCNLFFYKDNKTGHNIQCCNCFKLSAWIWWKDPVHMH